jgi:hypothetical protein
MPDATHFARSPEAFGRIGTPAPPGPCAYPGGCEKEHAPGMVTCLAHSIAYREWRQKRNSDKRREAATPDEQPTQVQCAHAGCPHSFTPKCPDQIYHSPACRRIAETLAKRERDTELARVRKQNREQRRAEARARRNTRGGCVGPLMIPIMTFYQGHIMMLPACKAEQVS